jgi:hypothetical protein
MAPVVVVAGAMVVVVEFTTTWLVVVRFVEGLSIGVAVHPAKRANASTVPTL